MSRVAPWALLLVGCASPMVVGTHRTLPVALQVDPAKLAPLVAQPVAAREPHALELANGVRVSVVEDASAALVDLVVFTRCGRIDDPLGAAGLTDAMLQLAFTAGTATRTPGEQQARLASLALAPRFDHDDGESWAQFSVRSEDAPAALEFIADALRAPRFDEVEVKATLSRWTSSLALPQRQAASAYRLAKQRAVYADVPTLVQATSARSLQQATPARLQEQAQACLGGANLSVGVSGDVQVATVQRLLAPLATLARGAPKVHPPAPATRARDLRLVKTSAAQVSVTLVGAGLPPGGNRAAAELLMWLLESDLTNDLRSLGKVYSVDASVDVGPGQGATWLSFTTRREVAFEATRRALLLLEQWWARWPIDAEAFEKVAAKWRRRERSPGSLAFAHARARLQDLDAFDPTPLARRRETLKLFEVQQLFARTLKPSTVQVVIAGPVDDTAPFSSLR